MNRKSWIPLSCFLIFSCLSQVSFANGREYFIKSKIVSSNIFGPNIVTIGVEYTWLMSTTYQVELNLLPGESLKFGGYALGFEEFGPFKEYPLTVSVPSVSCLPTCNAIFFLQTSFKMTGAFDPIGNTIQTALIFPIATGPVEGATVIYDFPIAVEKYRIQVIPVPELQVWGYFILGFGLVGGLLRAKQKDHAQRHFARESFVLT